MDMMFEGAVIKLNDDYTFTARIIQPFQGSWSMEGDALRLISSHAPYEVALTELSTDSCIWVLKDVDARIPFFRKGTAANLVEVRHQQVFVSADNSEILGRWINTQIEDPAISKRSNVMRWGDSATNDYLELADSGRYRMTRAAIPSDDEKYINGRWRLEDEQMILESDSGAVERLGILKASSDSLVLVDLADRDMRFGGPAKLKFTYTRNLGAGLRKFLVSPDVLDTIAEDGIKLEINVPRGFSYDYFGEVTADDGYSSLMTLTLSKCFWSKAYEEALVTEREDIPTNGYFVRFLEYDREDFIIYEEKTLIGDPHYELQHIFEHMDQAYCLEVSSFLLENIHIMIESLKSKRILN